MKKLFIFWIIVLVLFNCRQTAENGYVGQQILLKSDISDDSDKYDYIWKIIDLPEYSYLVLSDIRFSDDESNAIFIPDVAGMYSIQVTTWEYDEKLDTQIFSYDIIDANADEIAKQQEQDDWLNETVEVPASRDTVANTVSSAKDDIDKNKNTMSQGVKSTESKNINEKKYVPSSSISYSNSDGLFSIQVAAVSKSTKAERLATKLINSGFDAYIVEDQTTSSKPIHKVRVGQNLSMAEAMEKAKRIQSEFNLPTWVTDSQ